MRSWSRSWRGGRTSARARARSRRSSSAASSRAVVVPDQRAALARRHELALLHREAAEGAVAAGAAAPPLRAVRVRAVLDQVQPAAPRRAERAGRGRSIAPATCTATTARVRGVIAASAAATSMQSVSGVDVDDDGRRVDRERGGRAGDERHARHDHLVALADAARHERRFERVRPVGERQAARALPGIARTRLRSGTRGRRRPSTSHPTRASRAAPRARAPPIAATTDRWRHRPRRAAEQCGQIHTQRYPEGCRTRGRIESPHGDRMALGGALRLVRRRHLERLRDDAGKAYAQPERAFENPETKRRFRNLLDVTGVLDQLVHVCAAAGDRRGDPARPHARATSRTIRALSAATGGDAGEATPFGPRRVRDRAALRRRHDRGGRRRARRRASTTPTPWCARRATTPSRSEGMGFCVFGNIAIAIHHARAGARRRARRGRRLGRPPRQRHAERSSTTTRTCSRSRCTRTSCYPPGRRRTSTTRRGRRRAAPTSTSRCRRGGAAAPTSPPSSASSCPRCARFRPELIIVASGFDAGALRPARPHEAERRRLPRADRDADGGRRRGLRRPPGDEPRGRLLVGLRARTAASP